MDDHELSSFLPRFQISIYRSEIMVETLSILLSHPMELLKDRIFFHSLILYKFFKNRLQACRWIRLASWS